MEDKARIGGILSIVSGVFGLLYLFGSITMIGMVGLISRETFSPFSPALPSEVYNLLLGFYATIGIAFALIGALAIVGGAFALKKKLWGLALAGAIAGTITFFPCGITAVIFISLGQSEFSRPSTAVGQQL